MNKKFIGTISAIAIGVMSMTAASAMSVVMPDSIIYSTPTTPPITAVSYSPGVTIDESWGVVSCPPPRTDKSPVCSSYVNVLPEASLFDTPLALSESVYKPWWYDIWLFAQNIKLWSGMNFGRTDLIINDSFDSNDYIQMAVDSLQDKQTIDSIIGIGNTINGIITNDSVIEDIVSGDTAIDEIISDTIIDDSVIEDIVSDDTATDDIVSDTNSTTSSDSSFTAEANEILALVNEARAKEGLGTVTLSAELTEMANYKAKDMASYGFSHSGSYGEFGDLLDLFDINASTAGENIAMGYQSAAEVFNGWMNSEGHRANILNADFNKMGIGLYDDYWVQHFSS